MEESLGRLPAEIRNQIYELSLVRADTILITEAAPYQRRPAKKEIRKEPTKTRYRPIQARHNAFKHRLALIKTCRQARDEAMPIFYSMNKFHCFPQGTGAKSASVGMSFVKRLGGVAVASLRNIILSPMWVNQGETDVHKAVSQLHRFRIHTLVPQCVVTVEVLLPNRIDVVHVELKAGKLLVDRALRELGEAPHLEKYRRELEEVPGVFERCEAEDAGQSSK